jgi:hypothetical protein
VQGCGRPADRAAIIQGLLISLTLAAPASAQNLIAAFLAPPPLRLPYVATHKGSLLTVDAATGAGCWESTAAVWKGAIHPGNRGGHFHAIGEGPPGKQVLADVQIQ